MFIEIHAEKIICCAIKLVSICDEAIISLVCEFSKNKNLIKTMLDAYSQLVIIHSGFAIEK